jgi:hypothetical protein
LPLPVGLSSSNSSMFQQAVKAAALQAGVDLSAEKSIPGSTLLGGPGITMDAARAERVAKSVILQMRSRRRGGGSNEWQELENEANKAYDRIRNRFLAADYKVRACLVSNRTSQGRSLLSPQHHPRNPACQRGEAVFAPRIIAVYLTIIAASLLWSEPAHSPPPLRSTPVHVHAALHAFTSRGLWLAATDPHRTGRVQPCLPLMEDIIGKMEKKHGRNGRELARFLVLFAQVPNPHPSVLTRMPPPLQAAWCAISCSQGVRGRGCLVRTLLAPCGLHKTPGQLGASKSYTDLRGGDDATPQVEQKMGFTNRAREYAQRALKMFQNTPPVNVEENQMLGTVSKFLEDLIIEEVFL